MTPLRKLNLAMPGLSTLQGDIAKLTVATLKGLREQGVMPSRF